MSYYCNTYEGINDCGTGVGSLLVTSLRILLMPLLPEELFTDCRVVLLTGVLLLPGICPTLCNAGLNGVDIAVDGKPRPNMLLLKPDCKLNIILYILFIIIKLLVKKKFNKNQS